jgi:hypothetical protein
MNKSPHRVGSNQSENPQNEQHYENCPEHVYLSPKRFEFRSLVLRCDSFGSLAPAAAILARIRQKSLDGLLSRPRDSRLLFFGSS